MSTTESESREQAAIAVLEHADVKGVVIGADDDLYTMHMGEVEFHAGSFRTIANAALAAADAWDEANGIRRISATQIQNLAKRLMDADLIESLDVLAALARGDLEALTA